MRVFCDVEMPTEIKEEPDGSQVPGAQLSSQLQESGFRSVDISTFSAYVCLDPCGKHLSENIANVMGLAMFFGGRPLGLPLTPLLNRVLLGGFPYPTS